MQMIRGDTVIISYLNPLQLFFFSSYTACLPHSSSSYPTIDSRNAESCLAHSSASTIVNPSVHHSWAFRQCALRHSFFTLLLPWTTRFLHCALLHARSLFGHCHCLMPHAFDAILLSWLPSCTLNCVPCHAYCTLSK